MDDKKRTVRTLEGMNENMYEMTLSYARQLSSMFGIKYTKLGAECVKSVCMYPNTFDYTEMPKLLRGEQEKGGVSLKLSRRLATLGNFMASRVLISTDGDSLQAILNFYDKRGIRNADMLDEFMHKLNIRIDPEKEIAYDKYYRSDLALAMSNAADAVRRGWYSLKPTLAIPFKSYIEKRKAYAAKREEESRQIGQRLLAALTKQQSGLVRSERRSAVEEGGVCVVQYNKECLIGEAKQTKQE